MLTDSDIETWYGNNEKTFATLAKLGFCPAKIDKSTGTPATAKTPPDEIVVCMQMNGLAAVRCNDAATFTRLLRLPEWKVAPIFANPDCTATFLFASCGDYSGKVEGFDVASLASIQPGLESAAKLLAAPPALGRIWIQPPSVHKGDLPDVPVCVVEAIRA